MEPSTIFYIAIAVTFLAALFAAGVKLIMRRRNMENWIGSYVFPAEPLPKWQADDEIDVFIAVGDHWEPECYGASHDTALSRVHRWRTEYPRLFEKFRDVNGRAPQYTFFFPEDEYHPAYLDGIRPLVDEGFGDVDVHLHHDHESSAQLRDKLERFRETLFHKHGLLRRDPVTGEIVYGFIHGNWALCNSLLDGRYCGVDDELTVLRETGCYADFTLPSAPSAAQTKTINSIYYATDVPKPSTKQSNKRAIPHDDGIRSRVGVAAPDDHLLLIQGPLTLDWKSRKYGIIPRIENGDVHGSRPASFRRLPMWINAGVHVAGRPNWRFVKLYSHGCKNENIDTLLGRSMQQFHSDLADHREKHPNFRYHYVTAWEMAQLVHLAESDATLPDWLSSQTTQTAPSTPVRES